MNDYPIFLDLRGRSCLLVGGGELAARKIAGLLEAGAGVTVVSPEVIDATQRYANGGEPGYLSRPYGVESAWKGLNPKER